MGIFGKKDKYDSLDSYFASMDDTSSVKGNSSFIKDIGGGRRKREKEYDFERDASIGLGFGFAKEKECNYNSRRFEDWEDEHEYNLE